MLRRKKSSLVRVRRLFRGQTLQFDSNGKLSGYNKEIQVHKPSIRIPPLGPYLLLSEDNIVLHRVDTRLKIQNVHSDFYKQSSSTKTISISSSTFTNTSKTKNTTHYTKIHINPYNLTSSTITNSIHSYNNNSWYP